MHICFNINKCKLRYFFALHHIFKAKNALLSVITHIFVYILCRKLDLERQWAGKPPWLGC
jgi:hypothetical protein